MKNLILAIIFGAVCLIAGLSKRNIASMKVKAYLDKVNSEVDDNDHPNSNSSRDFDDQEDAIKAELNENAYNETISGDFKIIFVDKALQ